MIGSALSAEWFKLTRNRTVLIWAFMAAPVVTLGLGVFIEASISSSTRGVEEFARTEPAEYVWRALNMTGNPIVQLLLILGASIVFGGEYRWETWRSIVPRSSRFALISAKFLAFAIAAALSVLACGVCGFLIGLFSAAANGVAPTNPNASAFGVVAGLGLTWLGSTLQACLIAAVCALTAVLTRSVLAATLITFLAIVVQEAGGGRLTIAGSSPTIAAIPGIAARGVRDWGAALMGGDGAIGAHLGPAGLVSLLVWLALTLTATLAVFQRQDLSRE